MEKLMNEFEQKEAEIVFEWKDTETNAKGWIVINSLRGGAAAGGTRMRVGVTRNEVLSLAKTMEVKFAVAGPDIGGGKSGIDFDPKDPRKKDVLKRWYKAAKPILKSYYGTGGDMNVDEVEEVIPFCKNEGILFPLEGIINGHFKLEGKEKEKIINQLSSGVPLKVTSPKLAPKGSKIYTVGDLITGYGVCESVVHYYNIYGGTIKDKRVIIQGWGNVAATAAYYLAQEGAIIVGIIDKNGGLINKDGFSFNKVCELLENRSANFLEDKNIKGKLDVALQLAVIQINGKAKGEIKEKEKEVFKRTKINFKGDFEPPVSYEFSEIVDYMTKLNQMLKEDN